MPGKKLGVILSLALMNITHAGLGDDVNRFANQIGYANVTGATAAMTQAGGHLSAGSGYIATPVRHAQLMRFQSPNISASCAGLDWTTGGFSFISSDELIKFGQSIMQNAIPFAVDLALQTFAPQLVNLKNKFEGIANAMNNASINSCETAQLAVGAVAGGLMEGKGKEHLCKIYAAQNNKAAGWLGVQQGCSNTKDADETNAKAKSSPELTDLIKQDRNIVWYQFMKNQFLQENIEIAEYLLSMTGTIIYPKVGANGKLEPLKKAPLIIDSKTAGFHELLFGSTEKTTVEVYRCDDKKQEGCKQMTLAKLNISKDKALVPTITKTLESLGEKFKTDGKLSKGEADLINAVDFPLSMILQSELRAGWIPEYKLYAEIIARIVLSSYLHQILSQAQQAIVQNAASSSDEDYKWILANLKHAHRFIVSQYQSQAYKALKQRGDLVLRTIKVEHSVVGDMSALTQQKHSFGGL